MEEIVIKDELKLKDMIYEIRGKQVMLDSDLAKIYGYTTSNFNRQVKNNIDKFDEDFMFQLTESEFQNLMCKNCTSSWGGTRKIPYAFTEQGIYMLMTVLKGDLAIKQSKSLIRLFKNMKDYIVESNNYVEVKQFLKLCNQVNKNTKDIENLATKKD